MKCLFCVLTLEDADEAHRHVLQAHNRYFCVVCEGIFANEKKYNCHSCFEDDDNENEDEENTNAKDLIILDSIEIPNPTSDIDDEKWKQLIQLALDNDSNDVVCFCGDIFKNKTTLSKHHSKTDCHLRKCVCGRKVASIDSFLNHSCKKRNRPLVRTFSTFFVKNIQVFLKKKYFYLVTDGRIRSKENS